MKVLLVFLAFVAVSRAYGGCPGTSFPDTAGTRCFHVLDEVKLNATDASKLCANFGGHLASIHNADDNFLLADHFYNPFWIGASNILKGYSSSWGWTDGTPFDYSFWAAGQPFGAYYNQNCLMSGSSGLWVPQKCSQEASVVCETPRTDNSRATTTETPTTTTQKPKKCPLGSYCLNDFKYELVIPAKNFEQAELNCQLQNGHLVSTADATENAFVNLVLDRGQIFTAWIGGEVNTLYEFSWTDLSNVTYTDWRPANPLNSPYDTCVQTYVGFGWTNILCGSLLSSICKIPL